MPSAVHSIIKPNQNTEQLSKKKIIRRRKGQLLYTLNKVIFFV